MKYFRNIKSGEVFAYELDGSQDYLITQELLPMSAAEVEAHINPVRPVTSADVDGERDLRLASDVEFQGTLFQSRPIDRERITEAAQLAFMAVASGAKPGDLRWLDPEQDFTWIAADNTLVPMDAPTVVAFAKAMAARTQALVLAGRRLKDMDAIPSDYTDDKWWP
ncbi:DUF4376 domain-containing protein [Metapseudomonas otitidis]|uniref:DUF4376 domain-containing protein n=1 Tax=Metapseudomonas otitidis TaxID=319939 RepID=A0A7X3HAB8_9GAMM|nr:DUF4376 domain-containing protein [Pseudomonas otitidis]MWK57166.1 DUF4376 domain-containing protein [Pseudomonas otitidis]